MRILPKIIDDYIEAEREVLFQKSASTEKKAVEDRQAQELMDEVCPSPTANNSAPLLSPPF